MRSLADIRRADAFTFVEVLAAMLFMAIVIPVALRGLMLSNMVGERAARKRLAAELAVEKLNEAVITRSWADGDQQGDFGDDEPGFTWRVTSADWPEDTMTVVTVEIAYTVQDHEFIERLSTLARKTTTTSGSIQ